MAKIFLLVDDHDGTQAPDVATREVFNPLTGESMEIDLTDGNWKNLSEKLASLVSSARVSETKKSTSNGSDPETNKKIRAWGLTQPEFADKISARGRFPKGLVDAYNAANGTQVSESTDSDDSTEQSDSEKPTESTETENADSTETAEKPEKATRRR